MQPTEQPPAMPAPPPMPNFLPGALRIAVTARILWVGTAAYPLAMITRISVTRIVPKYGEAWRRFAKMLGIVLLTVFGMIAVLQIASNMPFSGSSEQRQQGDSATGWILGLSFTLLVVYFLANTLPVLVSKPMYAVAVDTAGPPTALLSWKKIEPAYEVAQQLTAAIENPQAEFQQFVHNHFVDLRHYEYGDQVNIHGGTGITGISK